MRQENWECPELSCIKELCRRIENESKKERMSHELPCIRFWCSYSTPVSWALWCLSWLINAVCHLLQASLWANSLSWPSQLNLWAGPLWLTLSADPVSWPSVADPLSWLFELTLSAGSLSWPSVVPLSWPSAAQVWWVWAARGWPGPAWAPCNGPPMAGSAATQSGPWRSRPSHLLQRWVGG